MKKENVVVERTFNVPAPKVWSALVNIEELKKWFFQLEDFNAKVGFKFDFSGGPDKNTQYLHLCEIKEIVEGKKIAYSWRYDNYPGNSLVTWEIFDKGEQTLVRITHTGLETLAVNGENFSSESFNGGWHHFLYKALKDYLETDI